MADVILIISPICLIQICIAKHGKFPFLLLTISLTCLKAVKESLSYFTFYTLFSVELQHYGPLVRQRRRRATGSSMWKQHWENWLSTLCFWLCCVSVSHFFVFHLGAGALFFVLLLCLIVRYLNIFTTALFNSITINREWVLSAMFPLSFDNAARKN